MTTYRVTRRATVRAAPDGQQFARLAVGQEFTGQPVGAGWVELIKEGQSGGFVKASRLTRLEERMVNGDT